MTRNPPEERFWSGCHIRHNFHLGMWMVQSIDYKARKMWVVACEDGGPYHGLPNPLSGPELKDLDSPVWRRSER